jgi:hypothetical protein
MSSSNADFLDLARATYSPALVTREQGKTLLAMVLSRLESTDVVSLGLDSAEALSPSFADELFAGLDETLGADFKRRIRIQCARHEWRRLISSAMQHRRRQPRTAAS